MTDRLFIRDYLAERFEEIDAKSFYREIFPEGELEHKGIYETGKYNALAVELLPADTEKKRNNARKYIITDELEALDDILSGNNFTIISPVSYAGKSRQSQYARFIYALAFDLDGITREAHLNELLYQFKIKYLPEPTFIIWSGTGLHLYYQFEKPVPCFANIVKQLAELKTELTKKIWNRVVTDLADNPQIESLFQGFRMCGTITKGGNRVKAFRTGNKINIEYLNEYVTDNKIKEYTYKSELTLKEAKEKYPEWYEKRIVNKQPRGSWIAGRAVYDWWLNELKNKILVGHRYYGVMVLAIYAKKCGIKFSELEEDAYGLVELLEQKTIEAENHFTREDILAALEMYNESYVTFPIDSIVSLTAIDIKKNKRNHLKQETHLYLARGRKADLKKLGLMKTEGRPSKKEFVVKWRLNNPEGTIKQCILETKLSKSTVYKYWNS